MAWVLVLGLSATVAVAPPAAADPCEGAAAEAQPLPGQAYQIPSPSAIAPFDRPIGHKPVGANDQAPLPNFGLLGLLKAILPSSRPVQKQAAVTPSPGTTNTQTPAARPAAPAPAPAAAQPSNTPPGTSLVGWVTGPDSPNKTIPRFAITGTDLGIMWDNGDPANQQVLMAFGDTKGYCQIPGKQWRYNALFRTQDRSLSSTVAVPDGAVGNQYSGSPVWRAGHLQTDRQQHQPRRRRRPASSRPPASAVGGQAVHELHVDQDLGRQRRRGPRTTRRSRRRRTTARRGASTRQRSARRPAGNENFQMGAFLKPGPGRPVPLHLRNPQRPRRIGVRGPRAARATSRISPSTSTGAPTATRGCRTTRRRRRR